MSQRTSRDSGPRMHFGAPPAKSKDFKGTLQRLINEFGDERKTLYIVFFLITVCLLVLFVTVFIVVLFISTQSVI